MKTEAKETPNPGSDPLDSLTRQVGALRAQLGDVLAIDIAALRRGQDQLGNEVDALKRYLEQGMEMEVSALRALVEPLAHRVGSAGATVGIGQGGDRDRPGGQGRESGHRHVPPGANGAAAAVDRVRALHRAMWAPDTDSHPAVLVCAHCCDADQPARDVCLWRHSHAPGEPICPTIAALDYHEDAAAAAGETCSPVAAGPALALDGLARRFLAYRFPTGVPGEGQWGEALDEAKRWLQTPWGLIAAGVPTAPQPTGDTGIPGGGS